MSYNQYNTDYGFDFINNMTVTMLIYEQKKLKKISKGVRFNFHARKVYIVQLIRL